MIKRWRARSAPATSTSNVVARDALPGLRRAEARRIRREVRARYAPLLEAAADDAARAELTARMKAEIATAVSVLAGSKDECGPFIV